MTIPCVGRLILAALIALPLGGERRNLPHLEHDAYVWQRRWTPAVSEAVVQDADLVRTWRVLAAQSDRQGGLQSFAPDLKQLARTARPIIAVVRLDEPLVPATLQKLADELAAVAAHWRAAGAHLAGLELDHDCATARLPLYAQLLEHVRARLPTEVPLSVTALPTWLTDPEVKHVFTQVSEVVLQVHAVQSPRTTLLDTQKAVSWVRAMAHQTATPFRVALPTYGVRVGFAAGVPIAEAEVPLWSDRPPDAIELKPSPGEVSALVRRLEQNPPATLRGFVWFRLPIEDDTRAWSARTWRAVVRGEPLASRVVVDAIPGEEPNLTTIRVRNDGDEEGSLPRVVTLSPGCSLADGVNGYHFAGTDGELRLQQDEPSRLPASRVLVIGWARCTSETVIVRAPA